MVRRHSWVQENATLARREHSNSAEQVDVKNGRARADQRKQNILSKDKDAKVITAGDFNEFTFVEPLEQYVKISGLKDLDTVAGIDKLERYTYLFDMNAQELDHMFVSNAVAKDGSPKYEHIHINTWPEYAAQVSDHDPSVARLDLCA